MIIEAKITKNLLGTPLLPQNLPVSESSTLKQLLIDALNLATRLTPKRKRPALQMRAEPSLRELTKALARLELANEPKKPGRKPATAHDIASSKPRGRQSVRPLEVDRMLLKWTADKRRSESQDDGKTVRKICDEFSLKMHREWAAAESRQLSASDRRAAGRLGEELAKDIVKARRRISERERRSKGTKANK
jgi:hypothetical protein